MTKLTTAATIRARRTLNSQIGGDDAAADLRRDILNGVWRDANVLPTPPAGREANATIMRWLQEAPEWAGFRRATGGTLAGSRLAERLASSYVARDDVMAEILRKQEEAERAAAAAEQARQEAADNPNDDAAAAAAEQAAARAEQAAAALADSIGQGNDDLLAQAARNAGVSEAREDMERAEQNAQALGFSLFGGDLSPDDLDSLFERLTRDQALGKVAEIAGRAAGLARETVADAVDSYAPQEVTRDRNPARWLDSERAGFWLDPVGTFNRNQESGLLAWDTMVEGDSRGPLVLVLDRSSSMNWNSITVGGERVEAWHAAQGIALGAAQGLREYSLPFAVRSFAGRGAEIRGFDHTDAPAALIEFINTRASGGTSFDDALTAATEAINTVEAAGHSGADVMLVTDGEGYVSPDVRDAYNRAREQNDARLFLILIGGTSGVSLEGIDCEIVDLTSRDALDALRDVLIAHNVGQA